MKQGTIEIKGLPFIETYSPVYIKGPESISRILGGYLITGVHHTIAQGTFKTTLDLLGLDVYGTKRTIRTKKYNNHLKINA